MVQCLLFFAVYLTWYGDPTQTMAIHWLSGEDDHQDLVTVEKRQVTGTHRSVEEKNVHTVLLSDLKPDTEYTFRIGSEPEEHRFRTAPSDLTHPLRFIVGGDVFQVQKLFHQMNKAVVAEDPLFAVIGGDIAYALFNGPVRSHRKSLRRWISFLEGWSEDLRTSDGRLIPFLLAAGNHDITPEDSDLFFNFFAFPEKRLYRAIDFSSYLSLVLLDTGHLDPIAGPQTDWLRKTLKEREQIPFRFPVYHVSAYPSYYPFDAALSEEVRKFWCPLFEESGCRIAFEHHNHTYKKTFPIRAGKLDPTGVVYLGDGCWGVEPRPTYDRWYLEKRGRKNNVHLVELKSIDEATIRALDLQGHSLDEITFQRRAVHP